MAANPGTSWPTGTAEVHQLGSPARRPRRLRAAVAGWGGGALCALGVLAVLFVGYLVGFTRVQAVRAQDHLVAALNGTGGLPATNGIVPSDGDPVAVLTVPTLGLHDVVVAGTSAEDLEQGPAYVLGSAPIGTRGNAVIAGRRLSFGGPFARIGSLRPGDRIEIVGSLGNFTYTVVRTGTAVAGEEDPVSPGDQAQLTLVTASSSVAPGGLLYVVADLAGHPAAYVARRAIIPPAGELGLAGDAGSWRGVVLWSLLLAAAAVTAVLGYRRTRRGLLVYLFGAPVLLALCLLLFESIAGLLPATL